MAPGSGRPTEPKRFGTTGGLGEGNTLNERLEGFRI